MNNIKQIIIIQKIIRGYIIRKLLNISKYIIIQSIFLV